MLARPAPTQGTPLPRGPTGRGGSVLRQQPRTGDSQGKSQVLRSLDKEPPGATRGSQARATRRLQTLAGNPSSDCTGRSSGESEKRAPGNGAGRTRPGEPTSGCEDGRHFPGLLGTPRGVRRPHAGALGHREQRPQPLGRVQPGEASRSLQMWAQGRKRPPHPRLLLPGPRPGLLGQSLMVGGGRGEAQGPVSSRPHYAASRPHGKASAGSTGPATPVPFVWPPWRSDPRGPVAPEHSAPRAPALRWGRWKLDGK